MRSWIIVARYSSLETAKQIISSLVARNYIRKNIGWAVNAATDEALLTVTITNDKLGQAIQIFQQHQPIDISVREIDWQQPEAQASDQSDDNLVTIQSKSK